MSNVLSNRFKKECLIKTVNLSTDTLKIILMKSTFVFNRVTKSTYADVSADELATGYGYTAGGSAVTGQTVTQDDTLNCGKCVITHPGWTAAGGSIGPCAGAIIIDDTHANDIVVGYVDFEGSKTVTDTGVFKISDITLKLS